MYHQNDSAASRQAAPDARSSNKLPVLHTQFLLSSQFSSSRGVDEHFQQTECKELL